MGKAKRQRGAAIKNATITAEDGRVEKGTIVTAPLVIMFEDGDRVVCHIHRHDGYGHAAYGLLVCDFVRHIANAFNVEEADVWEWVDTERHHHTTEITQLSQHAVILPLDLGQEDRNERKNSSRRTPAEIAAIEGLTKDFRSSIDKSGIDRQTALDALEYTTCDLLAECFADQESLDQYLDIMRERCHGLWRLRNPN